MISKKAIISVLLGMFFIPSIVSASTINLSNPPVVPFTDPDSGVTYHFVIYADTDNNGTYNVIYYNDSALTNTQNVTSGNGCPNQGQVLEGYGDAPDWVPVSETGYIGSTQCDYLTGDYTYQKTTYAVLSLKENNARREDLQSFYGCSSDFEDCNGEGQSLSQAGGAWLQESESNMATNIHSTLPLYDWGIRGGEPQGCVTSCTNNGLTRFISMTPSHGETYSTTTNASYYLYLSHSDYQEGMTVDITFSQPSFIACANSGAVIDAFRCMGDQAPSMPFTVHIDPLTLLDGDNSFSTSVTFPSGGKWEGLYEIKKPVTIGWGLITLWYDTLISSSTDFIIGYPLTMDVVKDEIASTTKAQSEARRVGIGAVLASTTQAFKNACNPFSGGFDMGDCLTLAIFPPPSDLDDDIQILKQTPPWGYAFRMYDILASSTATTTLPQISYTFTGALSAFGDIHFDPFGMLSQSGDLISEMKSTDPTNPETVWQIFMPFIKIFVYLVLVLMIIHDLTGIHASQSSSRRAGLGKVKKTT